MRNGRRKKNNHSGLLKILLFVVIFVGAAVFFGRERTQEEEEFTWLEGSMLAIGDLQVDYREGMVYLHAVRMDYEQHYGSDIWQYAVDSHGNRMGDLIKEEVLEQMIYIKVVCEKADEQGLVLSEEEWQRVDAQTLEFMNKIQESELSFYGVNSEIVRRIYADNMLAQKMFEVSTINVDTEVSTEEAKQHRFQALAIRNFKIDSSGARVSYEGEEADALVAKMWDLREQAVNASDFYKFAAANTDDPTMLEFVGGKGDFPESYGGRILAMKTGEISGVVTTQDYHYIFYCVNEYDVDETLKVKEKVIAQRKEEEFRRLYGKWRNTFRIRINDTVWDSLDFYMKSAG